MLVTFAVLFGCCAFEQEDQQRIGVLADGFQFAVDANRLLDAFNSAARGFVFEQLHDAFPAALKLRSIVRIGFQPNVVGSAANARPLASDIDTSGLFVAR